MAIRQRIRKGQTPETPITAPARPARVDEPQARRGQSQLAPPREHVVHDHVHDQPQSFFRRYLFSTDHKVIGIQFLIISLLFFVVGGTMAMLVRWKLAWPVDVAPFAEMMPNELALNGIITEDGYNVFFTMHASVMIFFVIIPMLVGAFGNYLIPLQIGARDMAFPFLNALAFWTALPAGLIMFAAFFVQGNGASTGWTAYPPISVYETNTNFGQSLWIISLIVLGISSMMGAINYITTIINMRAPGMTMMRLPLPVWALFITSLLILFATPVLSAAMMMLLADRELGTSFFLPERGGQPLLFQHLFWFYSHPAVYIMILPAMGIVSEVISVFSRKPIFGYAAMVYAIAGIAGLGFIVWGHHMFQSGMNPTLGTTFMVSTMFIAVPSAIKTFNWLGTLWGGNIRFTVPMLNALAFVSMFVIGGLSGIFMASTAVDIYIHDTYFIVAHIHYVLFGGSIFGIYCGIYYWFPKMFGRQMDERLGKVHFWLTFLSYNLTFFPMHILGLGGMMRRIAQPGLYEHLKHWQPLNIFVTLSAFALGLAQIPFVINFFGSMFARRKGDHRTQIAAGIGLAVVLAAMAKMTLTGLAHVFVGEEIDGIMEIPETWTLGIMLGSLVIGLILAIGFSLVLPTRISLIIIGGIGLGCWVGTNADFLLRGPGRPEAPATAVSAFIDASRPLVFMPWAYTITAGILAIVVAKLFIGGMLYMPKMTTRVTAIGICALAATPYAKLVEFSGIHIAGWSAAATPLFAHVPLYTLPGYLALGVIVAIVVLYLGSHPIVLGADPGDNPWNANTLEWQISSPPWYANYKTIPRVYHGPYEYSVPGLDTDWLPQTDPTQIPEPTH